MSEFVRVPRRFIEDALIDTDLSDEVYKGLSDALAGASASPEPRAITVGGEAFGYCSKCAAVHQCEESLPEPPAPPEPIIRVDRDGREYEHPGLYRMQPTAPPASPGPEPLTDDERRALRSLRDELGGQSWRGAALLRALTIDDHYRNQCAQGKEEM